MSWQHCLSILQRTNKSQVSQVSVGGQSPCSHGQCSHTKSGVLKNNVKEHNLWVCEQQAQKWQVTLDAQFKAYFSQCVLPCKLSIHLAFSPFGAFTLSHARKKSGTSVMEKCCLCVNRPCKQTPRSHVVVCVCSASHQTAQSRFWCATFQNEVSQMDNVTKMFVPNNLCFNDISQSVQLAIFHIRTLDDNLGQGWHHAWLPHNCELSRSFFFVFQMTNHFRAKWVECHCVALKNNFDDADQQASCHASVPAQLLSCGRNVTTHARQGLHLNALWDATFWNRWLDPVTTFVLICLATDQMTWLGCLWCHRCATDAPNIQKDTENAQCWGSFLPASLQDRKMNGGISLDQTTRVAKFALLFFVINWTRNWQGFPCTVPSQAWVNKRPAWNVSWESVSKRTVADDGQLIQADRCQCLALCLAKHLHTRWSKKHVKAETNQMQLFLWTLWSLQFQQKIVTSHVIVLKQMPWTKLSAKWIQFAIVLQLSVNPVGIKWAKSTSLNCRIGQNSWHPGNVVCDKLIVSMQKCRCGFCVCEDWHEMHNLANLRAVMKVSP